MIYYQDDAVTIYHGDCREILPTLPKVDLVLTDPPYGIDYKSGRHNGDRFPNSIQGDHSVSLRDDVLCLIGDVPTMVFHSPRSSEPPNVVARLVWHKPGSGMGNLLLPWRPDWEMILVIGNGWRAGQRVSSVLSFPLRVFRGDLQHPHEKPIELIRYLFGWFPPGLILDPFMGSGTTLRAAKDLGRRAIGIEICERYCEIAAKRMEQGILLL